MSSVEVRGWAEYFDFVNKETERQSKKAGGGRRGPRR